MKLHALALASLLFSISISGENYFPLSVGNAWYYTLTGDDAGIMTSRILSDTTIGSTKYFKQELIIDYTDESKNDSTAVTWLYVSGNDVYGVADISQPDVGYKAAQLTYQAGDTIFFPAPILGKIPMVASEGGSITVPSGIYAQTWKTVANNAMFQIDMTNYYADGVGIVKADYDVMGIVFGFELDSFTIASSNAVVNKYSHFSTGNVISAERNGIILHSSVEKQSTVSVFAVNGKRIAKKVFPTNTLITYSSLDLNETIGQYILFSENHSGRSMIMLPQRW